MARALQVRSLWRILRQTDLDEIKRNAEQGFHLVIAAAERAHAEQFARLLGANTDAALHPSLSVRETPLTLAALAELGPVDLAVLLISEPDLSSDMNASQRAPEMSGIPIVTVVNQAAPSQKEATAGQSMEDGRVFVASINVTTITEQVAPVLLRSAGPGLRLALARQLPSLRPALFTQLIDETARANAAYSVSTGIAEIIPVLNIPLNIGDTIVLTKNQLVMSYKIALVAGKSGSPRQLVGEILGVLGGGFLLRQVARQLVGLIPVVGIVPKVAVAYAGTWAIGRAVVLWATEGRKVSPRTLRQFYGEALERGKRVARTLAASRLPGRRRQLPPPHEGSETRQKRPGLWRRVRGRLPF